MEHARYPQLIQQHISTRLCPVTSELLHARRQHKHHSQFDRKVAESVQEQDSLLAAMPEEDEEEAGFFSTDVLSTTLAAHNIPVDVRSFTDLLTGDWGNLDLSHPALEKGYVPQSAAENRPTDATRGIGPRIADPTIPVMDASALVASIITIGES